MNWVHWALLSALFASFTAIFAKIGVESLNSHLATAIRTTIVLVFTWGIALAAAPVESIANVSKRSWLFLTLSGMGAGLSWLCYFRALQLGPASRVAPIDKLSVVFTILLAVLILKERLTLQQSVGSILIVIGAIMVGWKAS